MQAPHPTIRARLLRSLHLNLRHSRLEAHNARRKAALGALGAPGAPPARATQAELDALYDELDARQRDEEDALLRQFEMLEVAERAGRAGRAGRAAEEAEDGLPCPVCADGCIGVVAGVVVCRCGLRVGGDGVTEDFVRKRLCEVFERHWRCEGLRFEERKLDELGTAFLWSVCGCGEQDIVV